VASVFADVYKLSGGASVFADVYQLAESTVPSQAGWITRTANRLSVSSKQQRVVMFSPQQRVWIVRSDNE
jgi:hypothetical protein